MAGAKKNALWIFIFLFSLNFLGRTMAKALLGPKHQGSRTLKILCRSGVG